MEDNNGEKSKISVHANGAKTVFDLLHTTGPDTYYSPYDFQSDFSGDSGRTSQSTAGLCLNEESQSSYKSWLTRNDIYPVEKNVQDIPTNRNLTDGNECGSDTELYGLVSTILEEPDPAPEPESSSYFSQEISTGLRSLWSTKSVKDENLQYPDLDSFQSSPGMLPMQFYPESISERKHQLAGRESNQSTDIYQHFNGFHIDDQSWFYSSCSRESNDNSKTVHHVIRPPPGLNIPPALNTHISIHNTCESQHGIPRKDSSFVSIIDPLSDHVDNVNESCSILKNTNDTFFSPANFSAVNTHKMQKNTPFSMQNSNIHISNMQALLMEEQDGIYNTAPAQTMRVHGENVVDVNHLQFQKMTSLAAHFPGVERDMVGNLNEPQEGEVGSKSQPFKNDYITRGFYGFGQKPIQAPRSIALPFGLPTSQESKEANESNGQLPKLPSQASDHQGMSKFTSHSFAELAALSSSQQMQRSTATVLSNLGKDNQASLQRRTVQPGLGIPFRMENVRKVSTGGGGSFNMQSLKSSTRVTAMPSVMTNRSLPQRFRVTPKVPLSFRKDGDRKKRMQQNVCASENRLYASPNSASSFQAHSVPFQMFPDLHEMRDSQRNLCQMFSSCSTLPYGSSVPLMDIGELDIDPALIPYMHELLSQNATGLLSSLKTPNLNHMSSATQLHFYLDVCQKQWSMLEKERKEAEAILAKSFPGNHFSQASSVSLPRMPPNPSGVDRHIVDQLQEQAKVVNLLVKMDCLHSLPLNANIFSALESHLEAIYLTQAQCEEDYHSSGRQRQSPACFREDRDIVVLVSALQNLAIYTRLSRTALWCALKITQSKTHTSPEYGRQADGCSPAAHIFP